MFMMPGQPLYSPNMLPEAHRQGHHTYFGHLRRQATRCGHIIHPSASTHTPLCPSCTTARAKSNMNAALKELIAEGGLVPSHACRDRRWQRAKLRYEIMKQRQAKLRSRNQLREERELAWEDAHQMFDSQHSQATATFLDPATCLACASLTAMYPTRAPQVQAARDTTWWEQPGGLVAGHILVPRTPLRPVPQPLRMRKAKAPSVLRDLVQNFRIAATASDAHKQIWEARYRTESAVRRKHNLGEGYHFEPDFWDSPISAPLSRQFYQQTKENEQAAARRARGNTPRPKPPCSSLAYSERPDDVDIEDSELQQLWRMEELEMQERQARKVGEEVGYLYFVGGVDELFEWREYYLKSARHLIYRKDTPEPEQEDSNSGTDSDEDDSDNDDSDEEEDEEDGKDYEDMDVDE
jgi:hypothetical protein